MMKLKTSSLLSVAVVLVTAGVARGSDCAPPLCTLILQGTDSETATPEAEAQRTESVTLLVRGMMKSRSGAT